MASEDPDLEVDFLRFFGRRNADAKAVGNRRHDHGGTLEERQETVLIGCSDDPTTHGTLEATGTSKTRQKQQLDPGTPNIDRTPPEQISITNCNKMALLVTRGLECPSVFEIPMGHRTARRGEDAPSAPAGSRPARGTPVGHRRCHKPNAPP